jgi:short-subunit dehydrogenase
MGSFVAELPAIHGQLSTVSKATAAFLQHMAQTLRSEPRKTGVIAMVWGIGIQDNP